MERMRQKDADSGVVDRPPTDEQKAAIADARSLHASKLAELEILCIVRRWPACSIRRPGCRQKRTIGAKSDGFMTIWNGKLERYEERGVDFPVYIPDNVLSHILVVQ